MPISAKLENKVSFTLLIEGEDVFRFKKLLKQDNHGLLLEKQQKKISKKMVLLL